MIHLSIRTGMVTSINQVERIVVIHNGDILSSINVMKRQITYDEDQNKMISQKGVERTVDDFDLKNERPKVNEMHLGNFQDEMKHIISEHRENVKKFLNE